LPALVKNNRRSCVPTATRCSTRSSRARARADFAAPAAPLGAIERERRALDIAAVRDGDEDVLFDDQVFDREVALGLDNLRAAFVGEFLAYIGELLGD
jgi:hypothetical protein